MKLRDFANCILKREREYKEMPEMSKVINPPHMHDKAPSEKIIKLGRKITDVAGHKIGGVKVEDPEYWGLAEIVTEDRKSVV